MAGGARILDSQALTGSWRRLRARANRRLARLATPIDRARKRQFPEYSTEVLFIAGLPKSGTNWLAQLLAEVPGYRQRPLRDPDRCMAGHDICDSALESLPRGLYSVVKTHTRWSPSNIAVLSQHRVQAVVMHRDLRDQAVSRVHHVLADPTHPSHDDYQAMPMDAALLDSIDVAIQEYVPWVCDWLEQVREDPKRFCELRYEELHADPVGALRRVLGFYEIPTGDDAVAAIIEHIRSRTTFGLEDGRLVTGVGSARKGVVGDWRTHFKSAHVDRFKAGTGDLLIRLGYEHDMSWGESQPSALISG